jgi:hypothetical protein
MTAILMAGNHTSHSDYDCLIGFDMLSPAIC